MSACLRLLAFAFVALFLSACEPLPPTQGGGLGSTTNLGTGSSGNSGSEIRSGGLSAAERAAAIAAEPLGDYWIGRRYFVDRHRFWGYLRRPRQSWQNARLVLMDETVMKVPDRLPEQGSGLLNGYDNNYEYRIEGRFLNGQTGYDPFANRILPLFQPRSFTVVDKDPGWLFFQGESYNPQRFNLQP